MCTKHFVDLTKLNDQQKKHLLEKSLVGVDPGETDFLTIYSHEEDKEESKNVTSISTDKYYNNTLVNSKITAIRLFNLRYKQVDINTVNSNFSDHNSSFRMML